MQRSSSDGVSPAVRSPGGSSPHPLTPTGGRRPQSFSTSGMPSAPSLQSPGGGGSVRRTASATAAATSVAASAASQLPQSMATSMTIDEMRLLHQRALRDAEAKRTELRLVLASRYRELVGSSDEVIKMKERAQELHDLVHNLPKLMDKLTMTAPIDETKQLEEDKDEEAKHAQDRSTLRIRRDLSLLPRIINRALDAKDVHKATVSLIQLFTLIASQTDAYPVANALATKGSAADTRPDQLDPTLEAQMRMIFLQMQTLPDKIRRMANSILARPASYGRHVVDASLGAQTSAAALASLDFMEKQREHHENRAEFLLNSYFESKAKLLVSLLGKLKTDDETSHNAEEILSKIVLILQYDVVVHPYQIFVIHQFPGTQQGEIMTTLPLFDKEIVKAKCSKFLAAHLPLIRTKVKSVLVTIAGTTASALGQIRQSLYDKTDGAASMERLNENGICTWDEAVFSMIDVRIVLNSADTDASQQNRFSLWGALFSNTFSSLVHSILNTAFQSVHTQVISTLCDSLANAPPVGSILPHEAHRNALKIATDLDQSLLKVSEDAHELLVHAEERVESERRLRQSLYVQTCEIMGRLICELRRMASQTEAVDAAKDLIIGRLCFLLKFRLTSLRTLLSPNSSPASLLSTGGMISYVDLQSAFELADDDEDGLISIDEALEAAESAFSGTPFQGSGMVRDTLFLSSPGVEGSSGQFGSAKDGPTDVTLFELTLLTARGLRHDKTGPQSALGTVQLSLDSIVEECFQRWAAAALSTSSMRLENGIRDFVLTASTASDEEWQRLYSSVRGEPSKACKGVSPHVVGFLLDVASNLNHNSCPSDTQQPVPSTDYASSLGIDTGGDAVVPSLMDTMRRALMTECLSSASSLYEDAVTSETGAYFEKCGASALVQLHIDVSFCKLCLIDKIGIQNDGEDTSSNHLDVVMRYCDQLIPAKCDEATLAALPALTAEKHQRVLESSDLFFSSLFGDETKTDVTAAGELLGSAEGTVPIFHVPLSSSRRFALLPVQADRSLTDVQIRGKHAKEREEEMERQQTSSGNVISGGFGFLSSMLKTGKK